MRRRTLWSNLSERATDWGESARSHLPASLLSKLARVPSAALTGAAVTLIVLVLVGLAVSAGAVYRSFDTPARPRAATDLELSATERTADAPSALPSPAVAPAPAAPSAPDEAKVLLDLAESQLNDRRDAEVPAVLSRLIARRPELKTDERLNRLLLATASSSDSRASQDSFELLTGPMGETGAALVYELSLKRELGEASRRRAERWLGGKDFERIASLSVYAAQKLRRAKTCEAKQSLLEFASNAGGKYVLAYLRELDENTSCSPENLDHCFPCMRSDGRLKSALAKLEGR
jgi:hypothetical protein